MGRISGYNGNMIVKSENPTIPWGPALTGWEPIGNVRLSLDRLHSLSDALPISMQVDIPANANGEVGFRNRGT
jgi:alpha-N-arabinofuranosidase